MAGRGLPQRWREGHVGRGGCRCCGVQRLDAVGATVEFLRDRDVHKARPSAGKFGCLPFEQVRGNSMMNLPRKRSVVKIK